MKPGWLVFVAVFLSTAFAELNDDPLWKKLDMPVRDALDKFDGVMGVEIVDLTRNGRALKNPVANSRSLRSFVSHK